MLITMITAIPIQTLLADANAFAGDVRLDLACPQSEAHSVAKLRDGVGTAGVAPVANGARSAP